MEICQRTLSTSELWNFKMEGWRDEDSNEWMMVSLKPVVSIMALTGGHALKVQNIYRKKWDHFYYLIGGIQTMGSVCWFRAQSPRRIVEWRGHFTAVCCLKGCCQFQSWLWPGKQVPWRSLSSENVLLRKKCKWATSTCLTNKSTRSCAGLHGSCARAEWATLRSNNNTDRCGRAELLQTSWQTKINRNNIILFVNNYMDWRLYILACHMCPLGLLASRLQCPGG